MYRKVNYRYNKQILSQILSVSYRGIFATFIHIAKQFGRESSMYRVVICVSLMLGIGAEKVCRVVFCGEVHCAENNYTTIEHNCKRINNLNFSGNFINLNNISDFHTLNGIDSLDLSYNRLRIIPDGTFQDLTIHRNLYLQFNEIGFVGTHTFDGINGLVDCLNLSNNLISTVAAGSIPRVNELDLSNNFIQDIGEDAFNKSLSIRHLRLHNNAIRNISFLRAVQFLEILDLSENHIFQINNTVFSKMKYLKILNISNNQLLHVDIKLESGFRFYMNIEQNMRDYDMQTCKDIIKQSRDSGNWQTIPIAYEYYIYGGIVFIIFAIFLILILLIIVVILQYNNKEKETVRSDLGEPKEFNELQKLENPYEEVDRLSSSCSGYLIPVQHKCVVNELETIPTIKHKRFSHDIHV